MNLNMSLLTAANEGREDPGVRQDCLSLHKLTTGCQ